MAMKTVGRYVIKSELGRGGMATVYHAYDPRFERDVAVKVLPREFLHDPQFRQRFEREARTIANLEHPAIVPVHDYGDAGGQLYLVMRLMVGGSLSSRLTDGPLPLQEVARIFNRLAPALDAAHAKGIIHRDLKPDNILFDQWGEPHLSDFGIAKLVAGSKTALTATGGIVGTPAYMSPEQVRAIGEIDGRSDIYALGVILFEMLTGQQPFKADTPIGLAVMHLNEPIPLVERSNPGLPPSCQRVVDHAMAKDREERPDTATDLAKEISGLVPKTLVSEPVTRKHSQAREPEGGAGPVETRVGDDAESQVASIDERVTVEAAAAADEIVRDVFDDSLMLQPEETSGREVTPQVVETELLKTAELAALAVDQGNREGTAATHPRQGAPQRSLKRPATGRNRLLWYAGSILALAVVAYVATVLLRPEAAVLPTDRADDQGSASDFLDRAWQDGFETTGLAYGQGKWLIVASKGGLDEQQSWRIEGSFPADYITSKWNESFDLSDLAYGDGRWLAVMTRGGGKRQAWRLESSFPDAYVNQKWEEGFNITAVVYGSGQWAVIMTSGNDDRRQSWRLDASFPETFIGDRWADGFEVTSLAYGAGQWAVVMTQGDTDSRQTWRLDSDFPAAYVEEKWSEGFELTSVAYGAGQWAVVMTQGDRPLQQTWHMSQRFN